MSTEQRVEELASRLNGIADDLEKLFVEETGLQSTDDTTLHLIAQHLKLHVQHLNEVASDCNMAGI